MSLLGTLRRLFTPAPPRWIRVRYPGVCIICGHLIASDESAWWEQGRGLTCRACMDCEVRL